MPGTLFRYISGTGTETYLPLIMLPEPYWSKTPDMEDNNE